MAFIRDQDATNGETAVLGATDSARADRLEADREPAGVLVDVGNRTAEGDRRLEADERILGENQRLIKADRIVLGEFLIGIVPNEDHLPRFRLLELIGLDLELLLRGELGRIGPAVPGGRRNSAGVIPRLNSLEGIAHHSPKSLRSV